MGITATAGAKAFSHTFSLALTLAILTNLTQYMYWKSAYKVGGSLWSRQGPTILLAIATPLLVADLMRHCLQGKKGDGPCFVDTCTLHVYAHACILTCSSALTTHIHAAALSARWKGLNLILPHCTSGLHALPVLDSVMALWQLMRHCLQGEMVSLL